MASISSNSAAGDLVFLLANADNSSSKLFNASKSALRDIFLLGVKSASISANLSANMASISSNSAAGDLVFLLANADNSSSKLFNASKSALRDIFLLGVKSASISANLSANMASISSNSAAGDLVFLLANSDNSSSSANLSANMASISSSSSSDGDAASFSKLSISANRASNSSAIG